MPRDVNLLEQADVVRHVSNSGRTILSELDAMRAAWIPMDDAGRSMEQCRAGQHLCCDGVAHGPDLVHSSRHRHERAGIRDVEETAVREGTLLRCDHVVAGARVAVWCCIERGIAVRYH